MNRNLLSGLLIGVFAGFLAGYFVGANHSNDDAPPVAAASEGSPAPLMPPKPNPMAVQQRILATQATLAADPKNTSAWIALGNDYFDTHQAQNSVDAYAKALALEPGNPDVLTDQGIMYRELKAFDKAVADFKLANKLNPKHLQSLYNLGVVDSEDLKDLEGARKAWNRILELDPASPQAAQAKVGLAGLGKSLSQ